MMIIKHEKLKFLHQKMQERTKKQNEPIYDENPTKFLKGKMQNTDSFQTSKVMKQLSALIGDCSVYSISFSTTC
jgi:hypothetical protein